MATEFTWNIANLERYRENGVVFLVHYTVSAKNGKYFSEIHGNIRLRKPDPKNMIPFEKLTEEVVINWILENFGEEKTQEIFYTLQNQIEEKINPTKIMGVPWPKPVK